MSDRMRLIPFDKLMAWIMTEYRREGSVFGVPREKFYQAAEASDAGAPWQLSGSSLENPLGPAAGPNTQLAQNIIASYLAGSRFFELKTVQKLDGEDLPVAKPCILACDEGYNVEWSTELTVPDAMNEYIKAWFALHILSREFAVGSNRGFIFNMSVGYDLEGIKTPKIDAFIEGLKDASQTAIWQECREYLLNHLAMFSRIDRDDVTAIPSDICASITLSTLHGCPPEEIERIAKYLLAEKKLHTYVKCNPTLLGYEFARNTLDKLGYDYLAFDDHHFRDDLQFHDAVPMIARLKALARERDLTFGVKLSNTFPVKIKRRELPGEEMYMSGRALYPLTINLAYRLAREFNGDLRISYSGGADFHNIAAVCETGIWPITLATTILKPGGYLRLKQLADLLAGCPRSAELSGVDVAALKRLADGALNDRYHEKESREVENRKLAKPLPLTDCFVAPCKHGCPIGQDIPEYLRLIGEEKYREAFEVITAKNPLPFITGTLCNHRCTTKCTRLDYDQPVAIRAAKLFAAQKAFAEYIAGLDEVSIHSPCKVAVIGAGPAGLAAGYFLGKNGIAATIFDRKDQSGGIIEHIAPDFRISKEAIAHDRELIRKMGVEFRLGVAADFSITALREEGFRYIFIAIGAWKPGLLKLDPCEGQVVNVLEFLEDYTKRRGVLKPGKNVAVIGAGNSAMDAARAATRVAGVEKVYIVYRRTKKYMPADREELRLALADGVAFKELLAPLSFANGILKCQRMELGAPDASGRRSPVAIPGEFEELTVDTVIAAVGEKVDAGLLLRNGIAVDGNGRIQTDPETGETNLADVFIGGDALRGPATIVEAIADGTKFARTVLARETGRSLNLDPAPRFQADRQLREIKGKKGVLGLPPSGNPSAETNRCLECNVLCNLCVEVCPNRANIALKGTGQSLKCENQVLHVDGMCNECGNCAVFCPYDGAPYRDKPTLYWSLADFADSQNAGFVLIDRASRQFRVRLGGQVADVTFDTAGKCDGGIPGEVADIIWTAFRDYQYLFG